MLQYLYFCLFVCFFAFFFFVQCVYVCGETPKKNEKKKRKGDESATLLVSESDILPRLGDYEWSFQGKSGQWGNVVIPFARPGLYGLSVWSDESNVSFFIKCENNTKNRN